MGLLMGGRVDRVRVGREIAMSPSWPSRLFSLGPTSPITDHPAINCFILHKDGKKMVVMTFGMMTERSVLARLNKLHLIFISFPILL